MRSCHGSVRRHLLMYPISSGVAIGTLAYWNCRSGALAHTSISPQSPKRLPRGPPLINLTGAVLEISLGLLRCRHVLGLNQHRLVVPALPSGSRAMHKSRGICSWLFRPNDSVAVSSWVFQVRRRGMWPLHQRPVVPLLFGLFELRCRGPCCFTSVSELTFS